ncbi:hypothetical protein BHM03_00018727 [Ensete ventricosum]|uniref:Uncharacterized protein n=1 Tax=Ensete ventricosum TaxID=4639 RepID=A0A445MFH5_ENSVE|nr:hypothetical protein BHM03_00018727 [Ensete ventricosum]
MAVLSQSQENTSRWAPRTRRSRDKTEEQGFLLPSPRRHQPSRLALRDSASTSRSGLIPIPDEPAVPPVQKRTDRAGSRKPHSSVDTCPQTMIRQLPQTKSPFATRYFWSRGYHSRHRVLSGPQRCDGNGTRLRLLPGGGVKTKTRTKAGTKLLIIR